MNVKTFALFIEMKIEVPIQVIPIEETGCHLLIGVRLNEMPALFVLDTGASRTVVDIDFITQLLGKESIHKEDDFSIGVGSDQLESHLCKVDLFKIGKLEIEEFDMAVLNLNHVKQSYGSLGLPVVQGVLGGDVLSKYSAVIDYKGRLLILDPA